MKNLKCHIFRLIAVNIFLITFMYAATECNAQSTPKRSLLALSKTDHTLAIVDPATLKVIARIPVGEDPHEVVASSDGKTAYVSIYGGGSLHELNVIDLVAQKPLTNIDTRPLFGPHGITFVNGKAWFTAEGSKAVGRYDPATGKLDWSMGTGEDRTHMIYVTADGKKIYTTNVSSGTVSILVDTLMQPGRFAPPKNAPNGNMPQPPPGCSRMRIGCKLLFRLQEVQKDLMYRRMAVNYGLHQVRMEQFPSLILQQKNLAAKIDAKVKALTD